MELIWEIVGWAGALALLSAYLTVSMGWVKAGKGFQTTNLFGAFAFIVNGAFHEAWPSVVTNIAWLLISTVALLRMGVASRPPAPADDASQAQTPGVPETTSQLAVGEVLAAPARFQPRPGRRSSKVGRLSVKVHETNKLTLQHRKEQGWQ